MTKIERKLVKILNKLKGQSCNQLSHPSSQIRTKNGRSSKEISTWYQDHTSKIINTKSKSIRPNGIRFNSHVRPYSVLRCGQLEVSCTCRFDVGTRIFLFDNSTPNLTRTSSAGASDQLITYDYCPSGPSFGMIFTSMCNGLPISNQWHFQKHVSCKGKRTWTTPYGSSNGGLHGMHCSGQ